MDTNIWAAALGAGLSGNDSAESGHKEKQPGSKESYADQYLSSTPMESANEAARAGDGSYADRFMAGSKPGAEAVEAPKTQQPPLEQEPPAEQDMVTEPVKVLLEYAIERRNATDEGDLPHVPHRLERRLSRGVRELSLIEGNLKSLGRELRTIYISSCFPREGKTTAAVHAAVGLAEYAGENVLLIDSNESDSELSRLFGVHEHPGLCDVVGGSVSAEEAILPTAYSNLYLLPAGSNGNGERKQREVLEHKLNTFKENFDYVVMDGKSVMASSEAGNMAPFLDGILLVVECEKTKWEVVQMAHEKLTQAGTRYAGVVLNKRRFYVPRAVYRLMSR